MHIQVYFRHAKLWHSKPVIQYKCININIRVPTVHTRNTRFISCSILETNEVLERSRQFDKRVQTGICSVCSPVRGRTQSEPSHYDMICDNLTHTLHEFKLGCKRCMNSACTFAHRQQSSRAITSIHTQ